MDYEFYLSIKSKEEKKMQYVPNIMVKKLAEVMYYIKRWAEKNNKIVFFVTPYDNTYMCSRDHFYPAVHEWLPSINGDTLTIDGTVIKCHWIMYLFDDIIDDGERGKEKYDFSPKLDALTIQVSYEMAQRIKEIRQRHNIVGIDLTSNKIQCNTTYGGDKTLSHSKAQIPANEIDLLAIDELEDLIEEREMK